MDSIEDILEQPLRPNLKWDRLRDVVCARVGWNNEEGLNMNNLRPPRLHALCLELHRLLFCHSLLFVAQETLIFHPNPFDATKTWRWGWSNCGVVGAFVSVTAVAFPDDSAFLNWTDEDQDSEQEKAVVFRSLVVTVKLKPALDISLEAKAVKFLDSVKLYSRKTVDVFLSSLASFSDDSSTSFVQSIVVLISSHSQAITTTTMKMLHFLMVYGSAKVELFLVSADLIPQLINTLNPLNLPIAEAVDIHTYLMSNIRQSVWLATPRGLAQLEIDDGDEQRAVQEIVLKQVLVPSEKYICHLCVNRYSITDGDQSKYFLTLLARLLRISPNYQRTMEFLLHMPVVLTIPSCLTFVKNEHSIWFFLNEMIDSQREWNKTRGYEQQIGIEIFRMLRMEGIEDVIEEKLRNNKNAIIGRWIVDESIKLNNQLGMNLPEQS
ncbi:hypothetical protein BLNAU_4718 [Blattamonas nauphoetae]|uniref:Uncharacterized protein n=1 Tax=Blattamonas nauphoetae TaxID=2049346 RepID=A0ABQ9Y8V3_9EUKA|nr:hypothetical protein BLNAU_4718 [Blattamonas nauphoetae]